MGLLLGYGLALLLASVLQVSDACFCLLSATPRQRHVCQVLLACDCPESCVDRVLNGLASVAVYFPDAPERQLSSSVRLADAPQLLALADRSLGTQTRVQRTDAGYKY